MESRVAIRAYYTVFTVYVLFRRYSTAVLFSTYSWRGSVLPYVIRCEITAVFTAYTLLATLIRTTTAILLSVNPSVQLIESLMEQLWYQGLLGQVIGSRETHGTWVFLLYLEQFSQGLGGEPGEFRMACRPGRCKSQQ